MKDEMAVKIFIDACRKAQHFPKRNSCPLYGCFTYCVQYCNIPRILAWMMSDVTYPSDVVDMGLFAKYRTIPRGKLKGKKR